MPDTDTDTDTELSAISPSTPPSSTSTRQPATVDGPNQSHRGGASGARPTHAICADLEHPHAVALTALHSTTIGDGPIGRLLRDVGPLVAVLEAVEAVIEEARKVSPSGSMVCYVADLERALGRDAARPHKMGVSEPPPSGRCSHRWASGQDRNPHECTQLTSHLGLHRCGCGAVSQ